MAEYIDLDTPLELYVTHGGFCKKRISTLRDLLDTNRITYTVADVRPVVRGIWEKQDANLVWNDAGLYAAAYKCNRCGELNIAETNFCPNCGSDNRGRKADV